jgi:signal transduction histidine kinase
VSETPLPLALQPRPERAIGHALAEVALGALPAAVALLRGPELFHELVNPAWQSFAPGRPMLGRRLADVLPELARPLLPRLRVVLASGEPSRGRDLPVVLRRSGAPEEVLLSFECGRVAEDAVLVLAQDTTEAARARGAVAERATARAELLASLAAELNRGADLSTVLRTALGRAVALLGGDDGSVYLVAADGRTMSGVAEARALGRVGLELRLADTPHAHRALRERAPVHFARERAEGLERPWMERHGVADMLCLPAVEGDRAVALLFVSRHRPAAPPTHEDLSFGEAIATHFALAASRAMKFEAERSARARAETAELVTRRIAQRLAVSQDLTAALSSSHTRDAIAAVILTRGLAAAGAATGAILLERDGGLEPLEGAGGPTGPIPAGDESPASEALRLGQGVYVRDRAALARRWPRLAEGAADAARAALPLLVDGRAIGVLDLRFGEPREPDLEERAFLASIAQKCAQALDRARLYEAERSAREEAERVGKLQEQLLAVVGHDLRTPLSAITMAVGVLFRRGGLDDRQAQSLSRIAASAERMTGIIRDLLDFSLARRGAAIPIARAPVDLAAIAERAVLELQSVFVEREVRVSTRGDARAEGDEARLVQVISNLVGNALQHGPPEAPVAVRVDGRERELRVEVHNSGPAIDSQLLPVLFEPFKRGDDAGSAGLGLFIVREIVRAHGGTVDVRSEPGEGTTFTVRLPR